MAQADAGYVRAAGAGAWTEVLYGGDAGAFINSLVAALPASGGEIIIGPSSAQYRFTGGLGSISKPVQVICAPGANFQPPAAGGGAVGGMLRFTSGGAGSTWTGGQFNEASPYLMTTPRIMIDVQNGAHDVHLRDVVFSIVNTVASTQSCRAVNVAGSSADSVVTGFVMDGCRFRCNSTREATSNTGTDHLGWACIEMEHVTHAKVRGCTFWGGATPQPSSTGNIRALLIWKDVLFSHFTGNSGCGLLGLSDEQISGTDVIDAGASGLIEISNATSEGHHSTISDNNFEVVTGYSFIRQIGGNYGSIDNNHFGRIQMTDAVVRLLSSGSGLSDATAIIGNKWHNVSAPSQIRNGGYAVRVSGQQNVIIDGSHFTLVNKQGAYERVPLRVDNGCRDVVIGSTQIGFNQTATNQFAPFTYIIWEGPDAYSNTKLLFPTNFAKTPFIRT